ncbi:Aminomethyltransferase folate-binding domain-containing protein [Kalaharituber pfeilii]|nr:Aminomethyltransferase folate-binding domain-containing protein [Kalaharituber pfeilii]
MDDCMITMLASQECFYVALHKWELDGGKHTLDVIHKVLSGWGLIALQGPEAKFVLEEYLNHVILRKDLIKIDLDDIVFGQSFLADVPASDRVGDRMQVRIARDGYTGEDGFEISIPAGRAELGENGDNPTTYITKELLRVGGEGRVKLAGLAARDSLRLEAGLCLYGHDLTEEITPPEASLGWVVARRRRAEAGFPGAGIICDQLWKGGTGPRMKRVGLDFGTGGPPAREGMKLFVGGKEVGKITNGGPAISLGMKNIAIGYVEKGCDKVGSEVEIDIRGKRWLGKVVKMPFVETKYWRGVPRPEPKEEITGEVNQE